MSAGFVTAASEQQRALFGDTDAAQVWLAYVHGTNVTTVHRVCLDTMDSEPTTVRDVIIAPAPAPSARNALLRLRNHEDTANEEKSRAYDEQLVHLLAETDYVADALHPNEASATELPPS